MGSRLGTAITAVEARLVNPILAAILTSRAHGLLSRRFLLLEYRGRVTCERYQLPVGYARERGDFVVITHRSMARWWTNFRGGHPATVHHRGEPIEVRGTAVTDPGAVAAAGAHLAERSVVYRVLLCRFGVGPDATPVGPASAAGALVLVRFTPVDG